MPAFLHFKTSKLYDHIQLLEIRELLEGNDFFFIGSDALLSRQGIMRLVSQHDFEENFGGILHKSDLICNYIEENNPP